jgi:hypothetical protein
MNHKDTSQRRWNIFAFELKKLLNQHGMELSQLDDRMAIHRETVRRLQRSLYQPPTLPVLNREETQLVIDSVPLDDDEAAWLRAAALTTAIQRMLCDRIHQDEARLAAEQILPIIHDSLITHTGRKGLGNIRGGDIDPVEDSDIDMLIETALDALDRGTEMLQLSYEVRSPSDSVKKTLQASQCFQEAIDELQYADRGIRQLPSWKHWYSRAQQGMKMVRDRQKELGE